MDTNTQGKYCLPSSCVVDIVDTPKDASLGISPNGKFLSFWDNPPLKSIEEVSQKEIKVAGKRLSKYFTGSLARFSFYTGVSFKELPPLDENLKVNNNDVSDSWEAKSDVSEQQPHAFRMQIASPVQPPNNNDNSINNASGNTISIDTDVRVMLGYKSWNKNGDLIAFCRLYTQPKDGSIPGLRLFLANPSKKEVVGPLDISADGLPLNASLCSPFRWINDRQLLCSVATYAKTSFPEPTTVPDGPEVQEHNTTAKKKVRTYQDLIQTKYDEELFNYIGTSHFVLVSIMYVKGKLKYKKKVVSEPGLYCACTVSPSSTFFKINRYTETSRMVPYYRFAKEINIFKYDKVNSSLSFVKQVEKLEVADKIPIAHNSCRTGKRFSFWSEGHPALLISVKALDGGDANKKNIKFRDVITYMSEKDLFQHEFELVKTELRWGGLDIFENGLIGILTESWWRTKQKVKTLCYFEEDPFTGNLKLKTKRILIKGSYEDKYNAVGRIMYTTSKHGSVTPIQVGKDGMALMLSNSTGSSSIGNVPYLDILYLKESTLNNGKKNNSNNCNKPDKYQKKKIQSPFYTRRIWMSNHENKKLQRILKLIPSNPGKSAYHRNPNKIRAIVSSETTENPANIYLYDIDLKNINAGVVDVGFCNSNKYALTFRTNPYPSLKGYEKKIIKYVRDYDGLELNGTLFLPPGYNVEDPKRKLLPLLLWAYPREFKSKSAASQLRTSPYRFSRIYPTSPLLWLSLGYAVLSGPAMPILSQDESDATTANDTYIPQLVSSARAAVDHVCDTMKVGDRNRISVGGHSYGAFMTANLLAHAKGLFACGIARSGAYNRTLTPFGFQSEERTLWEAPSIYNAMSPFMNVNSNMSPLLLIHGDEDENSGTYPDQSKRMFSALRGKGVISKLVLLPKEGHGYRARESILHCLYETEKWLDIHCANTKVEKEEKNFEDSLNCRRRKHRIQYFLLLVCGLGIAAHRYYRL